MDIVINNACQTIRRPPVYYRHLLDKEAEHLQRLANGTSTDVLLQGHQDVVHSLAVVKNTQAMPSSVYGSALQSQIPTLLTDTQVDDPTLFPPGKKSEKEKKLLMINLSLCQ